MLCCAGTRRCSPGAAEPGTPTGQVLHDTAPVTPARTADLHGDPSLSGVHLLLTQSHVSKLGVELPGNDLLMLVVNHGVEQKAAGYISLT